MRLKDDGAPCCTGPHRTPAPAQSKGLCLAHYQWARRNPGKPLPLLRADRPRGEVQVNVRLPRAQYQALEAVARGGGYAGVVALLRAAADALTSGDLK